MAGGFDYTHEVQKKLWIFDLDDTLYPSSSGLWDAIGDRINQFIIDNLHYPADKVHIFREELYHRYGTTLRGLAIEHNIDPYAYLNYVHILPIEQFILPNPKLANELKQLSGEKIIFTNADKNHALRVIDRIGLGGIFTKIYDVLDVWPFCKPMEESFTKLMELHGNFEPQNAVLIEDSLRNIATAKSMGFKTIFVSSTSVEDGTADTVIRRIDDFHKLKSNPAWSEYWESHE